MIIPQPPKGQVAEFDLYLLDCPHFTRVRLFADVASLNAYAQQRGTPHPEQHALCIKRHLPGPGTEPTSVAEVLYCSEYANPSILVHELGHAALAYEYSVFGNTALSLASAEAEERFMDTQQQLLDELLFKLEELNLPEFYGAE